ncbi:MAG TPA: epoxide hydrolase [Acidimicrobiales bacterium]|nr:epoxide hydrolase [Acidimicrobiales bacterium]
MPTGSAEIAPFTIAVAESELADLRGRLGRTRWPDRETVDDWSQGIPLDYVKDLCSYWAQRYDWRRCETALNGWGGHRTQVDGGGEESLGIHFLHVRSPHADAVPLVLTHGWPGSVVEFSKVIGPLSDPPSHGGRPEDAFHVVCPSLPGYGFSDKPARTGWGVQRVARAWAQLMAALGYDRYGAQGGDWGAMVTTSIAQQDPDHCIGIHVNMAICPPGPDDLAELTEREQSALDAMGHYDRWDSGYSKQQSTRPQSLGYGLADSPAGQAAWIVEKFWAWTDCGGHPENVLTRDELLDNVMLYWLTDSGASSARMYWESFSSVGLDPVTIPSGISVFPKEIFRTSRRWAERRFTDLRFFSEPDKGGHFAAFEQPERFVEDVRAFFRTVR